MQRAERRIAMVGKAEAILRQFAQAGGDPATVRDGKGWTALHLVYSCPSLACCIRGPVAGTSTPRHVPRAHSHGKSAARLLRPVCAARQRAG